MRRLPPRYRGRLIFLILQHFDPDSFKDFLFVSLDRRLTDFARPTGFEGQALDTLINAEHVDWLDDLLQEIMAVRAGTELSIYIATVYEAVNDGMTWYSCDNPENSRFVGFMPFVDRNEIRSSIVNLEGNSLNTVLLVRGDIGAGKSYLWNYILYLYRTHPPGTCALIDLDDYLEVQGVNDNALMSLVLHKLGLGTLAKYDESAQSFVRASSLIGQLTDRINAKQLQDRYIVIDSIDNECLSEDGFTLLDTLILQVGRGNIPGLRVILMGYDRSPPGHNRANVHILQESIQAIAQTDVAQFFQDVADDIDAELETSISDAAADRAISLAEEEDADPLHDLIAKIAAEIFGPQNAGDQS